MEDKKITPEEALGKVKFEMWNFTCCSEADIEVLERAIKVNPIFQEADRINTLIKKTGKTPQMAILKLMEELGELVSALEARNSYKHGSLEHVQEESVDVLQCAISIYCLIQQIAPFDGAALMKAKNDKWEAKYINEIKPLEDAEWEENGEYFTGEYKPHPVYVYEGQSDPGKSHRGGKR